MPESSDVHDPPTGPTAFVLAGGGTKGSFEVGVLQYLVGVERIAPDIITATSAGAIAATVLAQARTLDEFAERVDEIEGDVLAWTHTEHVFGKQAWLGALDGTALGREIHQEITEGTRPPFPLTPATVLAGNEVVPAAARGPPGERRQARRARRQAPAPPACASSPGPGCGCPGSGAAAHQRQLRPQPRPAGRRAPPRQRATASGAVDPALVARPGPAAAPGRHRAARRRPALRDRGRHHRRVRRPHPGAGRAAGPVDLVDGAIASASVPMVFPPHPMADDDYVDGGVIEIIPVRAAAALGATRIIAVVAVPLALPRDERDYAAAPAGYIGLRSMGMIGVAERQIANLNVRLPEGTTLTTIDPVVDVVGPLRGPAGAPAHQQGLRLAARRRRPGRGRPRPPGRRGRRHATPSSRPGARPGASRSRSGPTAAIGESDAGTLALVREQKERVRELVDQRKQLGFPVPDGCEAWWTEYEAHTAERPPGCRRRRRVRLRSD